MLSIDCDLDLNDKVKLYILKKLHLIILKILLSIQILFYICNQVEKYISFQKIYTFYIFGVDLNYNYKRLK